MSEKKKKIRIRTALAVVFSILILLAAAGAGIHCYRWHSNTFSLEMNLNGPAVVTVEYGDPYIEQGAEALFTGTRFNQEPTRLEVTTSGQVDVTRTGTYYVDYAVRHSFRYTIFETVRTDYARRTVHVVDTEAPVISLVADPDGFTIPGNEYLEEGFTATDNYDGDLTAQVVRTEKEGSVTYQVSDSSGNITEAERVIIYHDPIPPQLVLKGDAKLSIPLKSTYTEPGYLATDNCDGNITSRVTVSGSVDTAKVGTYTLTYTVLDNYDNKATGTRTVEIYEPEPEQETQKPTEPEEEEEEEVRIEPENPVGGVIYLTFDDGPSRHTARLLDILAKYNVKASFFVVDNGYYSTLKRIVDEGHAIAIHSVTHTFREIYASEEAFFADLEGMQAIIETHTGYKTMLMRFPGGSSNTVSSFNPGIMTRLAALVEEKGFTYFDWNVDCNDAGGTTTSIGVFNNVVSAAARKKSSVVLMHDIKGYTVDAIEDIIVWGLENGYTFEALTPDSPTCHHPIAN